MAIRVILSDISQTFYGNKIYKRADNKKDVNTTKNLVSLANQHSHTNRNHVSIIGCLCHSSWRRKVQLRRTRRLETSPTRRERRRLLQMMAKRNRPRYSPHLSYVFIPTQPRPRVGKRLLESSHGCQRTAHPLRETFKGNGSPPEDSGSYLYRFLEFNLTGVTRRVRHLTRSRRSILRTRPRVRKPSTEGNIFVLIITRVQRAEVWDGWCGVAWLAHFKMPHSLSHHLLSTNPLSPPS